MLGPRLVPGGSGVREATMPSLSFTPNLRRHVQTPQARVEGATVRQALEYYFQANPAVRGYVLDDQGGVRPHVAIFLNQTLIRDRVGLSDPISEADDLFVAQALSGG
jgi:sulfur-carrier protein